MCVCVFVFVLCVWILVETAQPYLKQLVVQIDRHVPGCMFFPLAQPPNARVACMFHEHAFTMDIHENYGGTGLNSAMYSLDACTLRVIGAVGMDSLRIRFSVRFGSGMRCVWRCVLGCSQRKECRGMYVRNLC